MATLNIKARDNEIIRLPLTTENHNEIALVIYYDNSYYRCPLVHTDDPLASAVKIRRNNNNYSSTQIMALTKGIFDPVTHDNNGKTLWNNNGGVTILQSGYLTFNNGSISSVDSTALSTNGITFAFRGFITPTVVDKTTRTIFELYDPTKSNASISVVINTSNKCSILLNGTAIKTEGTAVKANELYGFEFSFTKGSSTGTFSLQCAGSSAVTVAKAITTGNYYWYIGSSHSNDKCFIGEMSQISAGSAKFYFGG